MGDLVAGRWVAKLSATLVLGLGRRRALGLEVGRGSSMLGECR